MASPERVKLYDTPVKDNEWFKVHILVKAQNIVVRLEDSKTGAFGASKSVGGTLRAKRWAC